MVEARYNDIVQPACTAGGLITSLWGLTYGNQAKKCSSPIANRSMGACLSTLWRHRAACHVLLFLQLGAA